MNAISGAWLRCGCTLLLALALTACVVEPMEPYPSAPPSVPPPSRLSAQQMDEARHWAGMVQARVESALRLPPGSVGLPPCRVAMVVQPDGEPSGVRIAQHCASRELEDSVLDAIFRVSPLPLPEDPRILPMPLTLTFTADDVPQPLAQPQRPVRPQPQPAAPTGTGESLKQVRNLPPLTRVEPVFSAEACSKGLEGWVELIFLVHEDGSVSNVNVLKADPPGAFNTAIVNAVSQWTYAKRADTIKVWQHLHVVADNCDAGQAK